MTRRSLRNITLTALALALGAAGFTTFGAGSRSNAVLAPVEAPAAAQVVPVAKVRRADLTRSVKLTAEFKPFQDVDLMAKVAGYVKHIYVDVGDRVKEGQLLATLEVPEMADELAKASASTNRS